MITNCKITTGYRSDHSLVYFNLNIDNQTRGPGYIKLNNSVKLELEYQNKIKQCIEEIATINRDSNPNTLWQIIKGTIRNESIKYTAIKKKDILKREIILKNQIYILEKDLIDNSDDHTLIENINNNKMELMKLLKHKLRDQF